MLQADRASSTPTNLIEAFPRRGRRTSRVARARRERIGAIIDTLIALLDHVDGEADDEPVLGAAELHPGGGRAWGVDRYPDQTVWAIGPLDDREGDDGDLEPSLGATNPQPGQVLAVDHDGRQLPVRDVGFDQSGWACGQDGDLEAEFDGREDGGDAEFIVADELGVADHDALGDPEFCIGKALPLGFDGSGTLVALALLAGR